MLVELFARQMAILSVLRSAGNFDEDAYREAIRKAHEQLNQIPHWPLSGVKQAPSD
jgi:hypothetical protein